MAITGQMEDLPRAPGARGEVRRKLRLEARGATASGGETAVLVHNISATGLLLESDQPLEIDEWIEIDLPQAGGTWAKTMWTSGRLAGCQFVAPISTAALSGAQLRGAADAQIDLSAQAAARAEESLGARLQRLRKARGLSLSQVAAQLGVSKPTVWAWEQGKARPVGGRIEALAAALGASPAELSAGHAPGVPDLLARCREQIAGAVGARPESVRILIEL
jgi:transcriptional regulator with XRE-family HTH domain